MQAAYIEGPEINQDTEILVVCLDICVYLCLDLAFGADSLLQNAKCFVQFLGTQ